jgi:CheY-like chemotaxis protein
MLPHVLRLGLGAALVLALVARAPAQRADQGEDYRQYFRTPQSVSEFWDAMQYEIDVGRYDLAATQLRGLIALKPAAKDLIDQENKVGMDAILRLRNIRRWSDDPKLDAQAKKDVEDLIGQVSAAVRQQRSDPTRIRGFIQALYGSPEENAYALRELYSSGAQVVPYILAELRRANPDQRRVLLEALVRLGPETVPPLEAVLDSNDARLKADVIDVLRKKAAIEAIPFLYYPAASPSQPEEVRERARAALAAFLNVPQSNLPVAKTALTREAERYYRHEVKFPNSQAVTIWRWDGQNVVAGWPGSPTVTASQAEEYYGTHFARQALALDPSYQPAQVVLLSIALDKAYERGSLAQPLDKTAPSTQELLDSVSPELVTAVLDRALTDHRVPVILGALRDLGARAEVLATRPGREGHSPLTRALYYPDRRVQMAAVQARLRIPGPSSALTTARVVKILARALAADPKGAGPPAQRGGGPRVLVAYFNEDVLNRVANAVTGAGFEPVKARTGRDVLRRLNQAADIDLVLLDAGLPDPGLAPLLGQLRSDVNYGLLPVVLTAPPARVDALNRFVERYPNVTVLPQDTAADPKALRASFLLRLDDPNQPALTQAERKEYAEAAARALAGLARGTPPGYDLTPATDALIDALRANTLSPEGQTAVLEAVAHLSGVRPQIELANVVLDTNRPREVRVAAAAQLVRHMQEHGPVLTRAEVQALTELYARPNLDPTLKGHLALVLGSMRPNARLTGERLLQFQPVVPAPPPKGE